MQCYEPDLCCNEEYFNQISYWNKQRIKPIKFISKVGFYNRQVDGIIVFITKCKNWWKKIPTEHNKATLVIYLPKMVYLIKELRKEMYKLKSDEERNL